MIIKHTFKVDQFTLRETKNREVLLQKIFTNQAMSLGITVAKNFPFKKNWEKSYQGELPSLSLNKDHEYFDLYETEMCVIPKETLDKVLNEALNTIPDGSKIIKLLADEHIPLVASDNNTSHADTVY